MLFSFFPTCKYLSGEPDLRFNVQSQTKHEHCFLPQFSLKYLGIKFLWKSETCPIKCHEMPFIPKCQFLSNYLRCHSLPKGVMEGKDNHGARKGSLTDNISLRHDCSY